MKKPISYKNRKTKNAGWISSIGGSTSAVKPKATVKYDSDIGVYAIVCEETKSVYIGQSKNIPVRLRNHKYTLNKGEYKDNYPTWQKDWDELGEGNFRFEKIYNCKEDKLLYWETYYIKLYRTEGYTIYNIQEETLDRSMVTCPAEYKDLITQLVSQLEKGKVKPEQLEQALYYNEMQF